MYTASPKQHGVGGDDEEILLRGRAPKGSWAPAVGFNGTEPLACDVWPGGSRSVSTTLPVAWYVADDGSSFNANKPTVTLGFPEAAMTTLTLGWWRFKIYIPADDEADPPRDSELLVDGRFKIYAGPGSRTARAVYHTYSDLTDECSWIDDLADEFKDQTAFQAAAEDARDWIDNAVYEASRYRTCWRGVPPTVAYGDALKADSIDFDAPGASQIVKASVYRTIWTILRRNPPSKIAADSIDAMKAEYADMAEKTLQSCRMHFVGDDAPPPINIAYVPFGRVSR